MNILDGGEGGGQLVRTALALSAVTGEPFRMRHVRRARANPGLQAQHCAAIETVAAVCNAETGGVEVGSESFTFEPGEDIGEDETAEDLVVGGSVSVEVGTAGSVPLVFDALLPVAVALEEPFTARLEGGTDAKWAPPFDYFRHVKLPVVQEHGLDADVTLSRRGFYPRGGGKAELTIEPSTLESIDLTERGDRESLTAYSVAEESMAEDEVAERQAEPAPEDADVEVEYAEADCSGSAFVLAAEYEHSRAGFAELGEMGVDPETVGENAVEAFEAFEDGDAAVDEELADQLLPFVAIAGGEIRASEVTTHLETNITILEEFGYDVSVESDGDTVLLSA
ncbi:RNA 3'-terminal phosphate cyclase [Halobacterium bonnevillei]|uniref:RNA 3'-terminal phosphate cyclase n=1 Tax=Halobacterium bonnevillei TaxID=2692200 RepID=A0A6B0SJD1_9EURY|nr:RNA 3'-terminal phosphate cyclase [Halobacterium bonnevillei]MXR19881.1 RNA 3'-terminal phosphate cyclase [Halobacterium bonnevillei]